MMGRCLGILSMALALLAISCRTVNSVPLDKVRAAVSAEYAGQLPSDMSTEYIATMQPDGTWTDIDYADRSRSLWQLEHHLDRAIDMARTAQGQASALAALRHWYAGNYHNDNWWYEKIGMPRRLLEIAYLLDDCLPADMRDSLSRSLSIIDGNDFPARPGGDRIQVLSNHAKVLLWKRDYEQVQQLFKLIEAEANYAPIEEHLYDAAGGEAVRIAYSPLGRGFQHDMTFHHRGDRVNSTLTYGMEVPEFYNYWHKLLDGTPYQFGQESKAFVDRYMAEAVRWHLVRDTYTEPAAYNRELARPIKTSGKIFAGAPLSGARYFPQSGYFSFKRPLYESAVRIHSERNANQEAAHNQEGIRNHYRGDGACHLSVTGEEYLNIWPMFDFRLVPGVTSTLVSDQKLMSMPVQLLESPIQFAGAVTDSIYGACALDFSTVRNSLKARKSWAFFDQGYVCLGSAITADEDEPVVTTIEQCLSPTGSCDTYGSVIRHDSNTYCIISCSGELSAGCDSLTGTWGNCVRDAEQSRQSMSGSVFKAYIDHGVRPHNATYAYAVCPGANASQEPWWEILALDEQAHVVASKDGAIAYAAIFEPCEVPMPSGAIETDAPCMLMLRGNKAYVSDPTHMLEKITIAFTTCEGERKIMTIRLPQGPLAGSSVCLDV